MTKDEKIADHVGPGGYKCHCCGPAPKHRKKWRRVRRARLKSNALKDIRDQSVSVD